MYELSKINEHKWEIRTKQSSFAGSFKAVITACLKQLKMDSLQLEVAVSDLVRTGNDVAHFGVYKSFMFSYDSRKEKRMVG